MLTTIDSSSFKSSAHWLYNTKNLLLNKEVLCLQVKIDRGVKQTLNSVKVFIRAIMNEDMEELLEDSENCFATEQYSIYFALSTSSIEDIRYEKDRNIILVSPYRVDFNRFDRPIINFSLRDYSIDLPSKYRNDPLYEEMIYELTYNLDSFAQRANVDGVEESSYYVDKLPLLKLMEEKRYDVIGNYVLRIMIENKCLLRPEIVLEDTDYLQAREHFISFIHDDIKMFCDEGILTLRLSVLAYRLAYWEFDADLFLCSRFYNQKLGFGEPIELYSNSLNLNFISCDLATSRTFRGYDLRGDEEAKQIQIAKSIIENQNSRYEGNYDQEIIHEITHLSYEKINQLILEK